MPSPSRPCSVSPQTQKVPSDLAAMVWRSPADTEAQFVAVPICIGVLRLVLVPSPSWPFALRPQAQSVPFDLIAMVCDPPAATEIQFVAIPIRTGVLRLVVVPSPRCPQALCPQPQSDPSDLIATLCDAPAIPPADTEAHVIPDCIWTGLLRPVVVPSPSCPCWLLPQAQSVPSVLRPNV